MLWAIGLALIVAGLAYIRLAPGDPVRWHLPIDASEDKDFSGGAIRVIAASPNTLEALDKMIRALDRTDVLAGSVDDGRITYITRSRVFGFPDYTTIEQAGDKIKLYARLRFGQSDLGVNRNRLQGLIAGLGQG